jgi:MFS transporter, DHA1 family, multidrug resistance protein
VLNYLPDAYPTELASVMAGNAFIRFSSGAAFPLFAPAMYATLGIDWATTLLAFLTLLFVPIPFAFYFVSGFAYGRSFEGVIDTDTVELVW